MTYMSVREWFGIGLLVPCTIDNMKMELAYAFVSSDRNDLYYDHKNDMMKFWIDIAWLMTTC